MNKKLIRNEINRLGGFYGQATRWGVYHIGYLAPTITASMGLGGGHVPMLLIGDNNDNRTILQKQTN